MEGENRLTVSELVEGVMPCIRAKHYSETYISGFQQIFNRMLSYCEDHKEQYFSTELAQQFLLDCYGVQPGTVERRCSRAHRAMDLLSDYQHFGTVMIRRRLNRVSPAALESASEGYLKQMGLRGRRKNTVLSHRKFLLRFTDFLDSIGIAGYEYLTPDAVNQFIKVILCNYSNSVAMEYYGMHLVEAGKNLIYIRDFLGHESIETTQVYAKANPEARRKALETMDRKMKTPNMPDWNDDPDLKAFLKGL